MPLGTPCNCMIVYWQQKCQLHDNLLVVQIQRLKKYGHITAVNGTLLQQFGFMVCLKIMFDHVTTLVATCTQMRLWSQDLATSTLFAIQVASLNVLIALASRVGISAEVLAQWC